MEAVKPVPVVLFSFGSRQSSVEDAMDQAGFEYSDS